MPELPACDDPPVQLVTTTDVVRIRVPITTENLHRAAARYAAISGALAQAEAVGRRLVGGPWIEGDLGGDQVELVRWAGQA